MKCLSDTSDERVEEGTEEQKLIIEETKDVNDKLTDEDETVAPKSNNSKSSESVSNLSDYNQMYMNEMHRFYSRESFKKYVEPKLIIEQSKHLFMLF